MLRVVKLSDDKRESIEKVSSLKKKHQKSSGIMNNLSNDIENSDLIDINSEIEEKQTKIKSIEEEIDIIKNDNNNIAIWGDDHIRFQFFIAMPYMMLLFILVFYFEITFDLSNTPWNLNDGSCSTVKDCKEMDQNLSVAYGLIPLMVFIIGFPTFAQLKNKPKIR